jgi:hypothetical protein
VSCDEPAQVAAVCVVRGRELRLSTTPKSTWLIPAPSTRAGPVVARLKELASRCGSWQGVAGGYVGLLHGALGALRDFAISMRASGAWAGVAELASHIHL